MSVTQDYKILTVTKGEAQAIRFALSEAAEIWARMAKEYPIHTSFGRGIHDTLANLQSAITKVEA